MTSGENNTKSDNWESLIATKMRPCESICRIDDARKRNAARATKNWRSRNIDRYKAKKKEWESTHPEKLKIYNERHRNLRKRWAEEHHDRVLELGRINDRKRRKTEKRKAWEKEYRQRPEVKAKRREYDKKRAASPERKAYERERSRRRREQSKLKKEVA